MLLYAKGLNSMEFLITMGSNKFDLRRMFVLLLLVLLVFSHGAEGRRAMHGAEHAHTKSPNGSPVTTIQSEDGDIVDCFDIYRQPALNHPALKNHKIQLRPTSSGEEKRSSSTSSNKIHYQTWRKSGSCPEGTVPILRSTKNMKTLPAIQKKRIRRGGAALDGGAQVDHFDPRSNHEYAAVDFYGGTYMGAKAKINIWNPMVEVSGELSSSQLWVMNDDGGTNSVEAGACVYADAYGDNRTRMFIFWTPDNYQSGCLDTRCPGFVQVSNQIAPGLAFATSSLHTDTVKVGYVFDQISVYSGLQGAAEYSLYKDQSTGNWLFQFNGELVGYWPNALFTTMKTEANLVEMGGEIVNVRIFGHHTSTQMGNGHFSGEGFGKAAFFSNIQIMDTNFVFQNPLAPHPSQQMKPATTLWV